MGKIQNYYTSELDRLTEDVKLDSFQKNLEQNTSGRKKMSELRGLFESKLQEADKFKSIITKVDENIESLKKADNQNNEKNSMNNSLQKAVYDEIDYFQTTSKPNCLATEKTLSNKLEELNKTVTDLEKRLEETKKANKKSTGNRILDFFGLSKTKDKNEKEKENAIEKKELKKQLENCRKELINTEQKLRNSIATLRKFKSIEKSVKNFQQRNFGMMTEKSVMNAIHNPTDNKHTGMIGCLFRVGAFLNNTTCIINYDKNAMNSSFKYQHWFSKFPKDAKDDVRTIKYMKDILTDKKPKHFMECKRKLEEFSKLDISSLTNAPEQNRFDNDKFVKYKDDLKNDIKNMFDNISTMIKECGDKLNSSNFEKINEKTLKTYAKEIYKEQNKLVKKYTELKKNFTKKVKNLLPKMKNRDELAQGLAALAFFNCIHSKDLNDKYPALFNDMIVKNMDNLFQYLRIAGAISLTVCALMYIISIAMCFTTAMYYPIALILLIKLTHYPMMCALGSSLWICIAADYYYDLDAISGAIIEQSKAAKQ